MFFCYFSRSRLLCFLLLLLEHVCIIFSWSSKQPFLLWTTIIRLISFFENLLCYKNLYKSWWQKFIINSHARFKWFKMTDYIFHFIWSSHITYMFFCAENMYLIVYKNDEVFMWLEEVSILSHWWFCFFGRKS